MQSNGWLNKGLSLFLPVLLTNCIETKTTTATSARQTETVSCSEKQTTFRSLYDIAINQYNQRKFVTHFSSLSESELSSYIRSSADLIYLFENDLKACIIESDGSITKKVWTVSALAKERQMHAYLYDLREKQYKKQARTSNPSTTSSHYPTVSSTSELDNFLSDRLNESIKNGTVTIKLEQGYAYGDVQNYSNEELIRQTVDYYYTHFSEIRPIVLQSMRLMVTNYSNPSAKLSFANEDSKLQPVLSYFQKKYGKDLSKVVVIQAPISSIPHAQGIPNAAGLFISPIALPVLLDIQLPLRKIDSSFDTKSYVKGRLVIGIKDLQTILLKALRFHYQSEMLIYVDPMMINKANGGLYAFEAVVAHELRHLVDFFDCQNNMDAADCNQEKLDQDLAQVKQEAANKERINYQKYLSNSKTLQSRYELGQLYIRSGQSTNYQKSWVDDILKQYFDGSYYRQYQYYFTIKERHGYKEQLNYLLYRGLSKQEAVELTLNVNGKQGVYLKNKEEFFSVPGRPWLEELFESLLP